MSSTIAGAVPGSDEAIEDDGQDDLEVRQTPKNARAQWITLKTREHDKH
jgi:hypothetical protein